MNFINKVVIVTGASSGIGAAAAKAFSAEGARVTLVGRNETKLAKQASQCKNSLVIRADVSNDEDAKRIIEQTIEKFGQLDVLVNNAAVCTFGTIASGSIMEAYDKAMNVNLRAVINLTTLSVPHLIKTKGNIVNISSIGAHIPSPAVPELIAYTVSKAGLNHFGSCAAVELSSYGVRVNTISPGPVKTDILINCGFPNTWDDYNKTTLLNRVSEPEEIADLILFLASDKAKGVTGSNYVADNGVFLKRN